MCTKKGRKEGRKKRTEPEPGLKTKDLTAKGSKGDAKDAGTGHWARTENMKTENLTAKGSKGDAKDAKTAAWYAEEDMKTKDLTAKGSKRDTKDAKKTGFGAEQEEHTGIPVPDSLTKPAKRKTSPPLMAPEGPRAVATGAARPEGTSATRGKHAPT